MEMPLQLAREIGEKFLHFCESPCPPGLGGLPVDRPSSRGGCRLLPTPDQLRSKARGLRFTGRVDLTSPPALPYKPRNFARRSLKRLASKSPVFARRSSGLKANTIQRRRTREADLSTEQAGAQAPSRFPRPHGHQRRAQGGCRPPRARAQTAERLTPRKRLGHGTAEATGRVPRRCGGAEGPGGRLRPAGAPT